MKRELTAALIFAVTLSLVPTLSFARYIPKKEKDKNPLPGLQRVLILDGSFVHNVGELHMHVINLGNFGSWPGTGLPFAEAPSGQWPAGSGVEYLFTSGLWVGALKGGVPAVSTAAYEWEFRPTQEDVDRIYRTAEGASGGNRRPSPTADDDRDGVIDEDPLDGHDNDMDGFIDEDFAAVSKQMFRMWYTDDQPIALRIYAEHNPLNILVTQESYQWEEARFDDFVGIQFTIQNIGDAALDDLYIGFFADCDAGPRERDDYWEDDATARTFVPTICTDLGPVQVDIAYTFDADTDEGQTTGYFGVMFLGHTTDPTGEQAPQRVGISTYANFSGQQSFDEGGDPTNDFERYELLSQQTIERASTVPRDFRMLVSAGPFLELLPDSILIFQTAFVAGEGLAGLISNASGAQLTFDGAWFNLDGDPTTGVDSRETRIVGPPGGVSIAIDTCRTGEADFTIPRDVARGEILWINNDCVRERFFMLRCGYSDDDSLKFRTGVEGKETQLNWIVGTAPPPPNMRFDDHSRDGLVIYWDNFSETVPDVKTQVFDFEGYRIWRADNWTRPVGTSAQNGPSFDLWKLLFQVDMINNFGDDLGLDRLRYEPLTKILSPQKKEEFLDFLEEYMMEFPLKEPPCPQGVNAEVCDTLKALARWELGLDGGRQYYRYIDRLMHQGRPYFYAVTAMDHDINDAGQFSVGKAGDPSGNFAFVEPKSAAQEPFNYDEGRIYVVPNPATTASMSPWTLNPNNEDPTGIKIEFRNLPRASGMIRIYTIAGDLVQKLAFDGSIGVGTVKWDLVSRNGQDVTSGVYLYAVETEDSNFDRFIGKFVVIR
jgi:hypothetical protein